MPGRCDSKVRQVCLERPCSCLHAQQRQLLLQVETLGDGPGPADPLPQDVQLLSFSPWDEASVSTLSWYCSGAEGLLSGLEMLEIDPDLEHVQVGELG